MRQFFPSKRTYLGVTEPLSTAPPAESDLESSNKLRKTLEPWTLVPRDVEAKRDHALQIVESIFLQFVRQTCQRKNLAESLCLEAGGRLETFGSHRLGVDHKDSDIDVVCVGPKFVTREDFFSGMLTVLKDCPLVSAAVAITDAYVPVINLVLNGIEIDLVYTRLLHSKVQKSLNLLDDSIIEHLDDRCIRSLNGLRVAERILNLVPDIATFKTVLQFIKVWAKQRGLYSNILGFLGGVSWAIAVARVCQLYPNSSPNIIATKFFSTLLHWDWNTPILLQKIKDTDPFYTMYTAKPHLMPIITPAYPCMATTHNVSSSSFQIIQQEFKRGTVMTEMVALGKAAWADVLDPTDAFFGKYKNYIQLIVSSDSQDLQFKWSGLVESKIRQLAIKLELQEGIQLVHPFAHSFRKKAPCQSVEEASNACLGIYPASNVGSAPYPEIMSVYTTTFYIGLELAVSPTASMSSRGLDLSLLIQGFVAIVKGWESFKEEHMCIVVNKMKSGDIPLDHSSSQNLMFSKQSAKLSTNMLDVETGSTGIQPLANSKNSTTDKGTEVKVSSSSAPPNPNGVLFIGGLDLTVTEFRLKKIFEKHGQITKLEYHWHKQGPKAGHPKGSAFIKFSTLEAGLAVIQALNGTVPAWNGGKKLSVAWSKWVGVESSQQQQQQPDVSGIRVPVKRPRTKQEFEQRALEASINKKVQLAPTHASAESRIAAIERKLKELDDSSAVVSTSQGIQHPGSNHSSVPAVVPIGIRDPSSEHKLPPLTAFGANKDISSFVIDV